MKKLIIILLLVLAPCFAYADSIGGGGIYGVPTALTDKTINNTIIGGTTPAAGTFTPLKSKGPAIITTFAGTVTATASTTVTFSSAADAILAGYDATNPTLGTTLISNALPRHIVSWTNATTAVVNYAVTWAGTAITSTQAPISYSVNSSGVFKSAVMANGEIFSTVGIVAGDANTGNGNLFNGLKTTGTAIINVQSDDNVAGLRMYTAGSNGESTVNAAAGVLKLQSIGTTGPGVSINLSTLGTNAKNVFGIASGTMPTALVADAVQMGVFEYNGATGDQRLNIYSEATVAKKTAIGSGTVSINGAVTSGGGFTRQLAEAVSSALSGATGSIAVNVPTGARILGIQLRVDTEITSSDGGTSWTAVYVNTPTTAICATQALAKSTRFNAVHPAYEITTGTVTITLSMNAGKLFAAGVVRAIVYYDAIDAMIAAP